MTSEQALSAEGATGQMAAYIHDTTVDDLPKAVVDHATKMVVDTLGVTVAATDDEVTSLFHRYKTSLSSDGSVRVPGTGMDGSIDDVAHMIGVMSHALDFDDVHHEMGGHPSAPVLSALLPVAEQMGASGSDLLCSFVVGTDVEVRLANALNPGHYERGWHPTAVLGTMGAAAAVANLRGLETNEIERTLGIAASKASGIKGNFGTMTKPLHVGESARNGLEAAELAALGFSANDRILELEFGGFCDLFQGESEYDLTEPLDKLGSTWGLLDPPVGFKPYPCCGSTHSAIDAALDLHSRIGVDPESILSVQIEEHPRRLDHTNRPTPASPLDCKFSVQYCVAAALMDGDLWLDHFEIEATESPRYRSLLKRTAILPNRDSFSDREWGARVTVKTSTDTHVVDVDAPLGSAENPLTWTELEDKYRRCATLGLDDEAVTRSLETLQDLPTVKDVGHILNDLS